MQWDCFKSLSKFSLQLYLSHMVMSDFIMSIVRIIGLQEWWRTDTLVLSVYTIAYLYSTAERRIMEQIYKSCGLAAQNSDDPEKERLAQTHP